MEYLEGGQVNDLPYLKKNKIDPFDVSNKLGILYSNMIFLNGWEIFDNFVKLFLILSKLSATFILTHTLATF